MGDGEEPIDADPYRLFEDTNGSHRGEVAPYNPQVLEQLQGVLPVG